MYNISLDEILEFEEFFEDIMFWFFDFRIVGGDVVVIIISEFECVENQLVVLFESYVVWGVWGVWKLGLKVQFFGRVLFDVVVLLEGEISVN